jgi:thiol-disulfide isomerase/thioredoxin
MDDGRRRVFASALILGGGLMLLGVALAVYLIQHPPTPRLPVVGTRLSNFTLTDLNGKTVQLSDFAGQTVLINAWATWCPPCREEMPMLVDYYRQHHSQKFTILAINAGEASQDVSGFAQEYGMEFPVLLDTNSTFLDSQLIDSLPTTILLGPDGKVKALHVGLMTAEIFQNEILAKIN